MFLFSWLTQSIPFTPDFLISLINARFYWHISSASCHRHQKLWNVRSLQANIISTRLQEEHRYNSPGLLTSFFKHSPITHTVHLFSLQKTSILDDSVFSPQRNVLPTHDRNLLINKLPKRCRFVLHNQQESDPQHFFTTVIKKKKDVGGSPTKLWWRGLPWGKRVEKHLEGPFGKLHKNWSPSTAPNTPVWAVSASGFSFWMLESYFFKYYWTPSSRLITMLSMYCHYQVFHLCVILQTSSENPWVRGNYLDPCFRAEDTEEAKQRVSHRDTEKAYLRDSVFRVSEFKCPLRTLQQGNKTAIQT